MLKSMSLQRLKTKDLQWPPLNMPINQSIILGKKVFFFKEEEIKHFILLFLY